MPPPPPPPPPPTTTTTPPNILLFKLPPPNDESMDLYRSLIPPGIPCLFNAICVLAALSKKKISKAIPNDSGNGTTK
jgi:hypothetical protein